MTDWQLHPAEDAPIREQVSNIVRTLCDPEMLIYSAAVLADVLAASRALLNGPPKSGTHC